MNTSMFFDLLSDAILTPPGQGNYCNERPSPRHTSHYPACLMNRIHKGVDSSLFKRP